MADARPGLDNRVGADDPINRHLHFDYAPRGGAPEFIAGCENELLIPSDLGRLDVEVATFPTLETTHGGTVSSILGTGSDGSIVLCSKSSVLSYGVRSLLRTLYSVGSADRTHSHGVGWFPVNKGLSSATYGIGVKFDSVGNVYIVAVNGAGSFSQLLGADPAEAGGYRMVELQIDNSRVNNKEASVTVWVNGSKVGSALVTRMPWNVALFPKVTAVCSTLPVELLLDGYSMGYSRYTSQDDSVSSGSGGAGGGTGGGGTGGGLGSIPAEE